MKLMTFTGLFALMAIGLFAASHLVYLYTFAPREHIADDTFLSTVSTKRALAVVAHDDDLAAFAGTFSHLVQDGWEVEYIAFYRGVGDSLESVRKAEMRNMAQVLGLSKLHILDFDFIASANPQKVSYMPIPYERFSTYFHADSLCNLLKGYIRTVKPSVIFSLDDVIGGYGHPEHILVSQSVRWAASELMRSGEWQVQKIYQGVYPDSQEHAVCAHLPVHQAALKTYGDPGGMPAPTARLAVSSYHREKMAAIRGFASQQGSLRRFIVYHHRYPSWLYFRIFSHEHFRVLDV